jgi:preprotein translocase subunit SecE
MARNRKRAKERRDRRPQTVGIRASLSGNGPAPEELPGPLEHAAPDAELAEAQLAVGRGDFVGDDFESEAELEPSGDGGGLGGIDIGGGFDGDGASEPPGGGEIALPAPGVQPRVRPHNRLIAFLEGSWRELQRVQWPDRRQVMQATAVVLGFVIVAGLVLAVADTLPHI